MKKILLLTLFSYFFVLGAFAQSLTLSNAYGNVKNGDTIVMASTDSHAIFAIGITVNNTSKSNMAVWVKKTELSIISGTENYFCWAQCYLPTTFFSPDSIVIKKGDSSVAFSGDYDAQGNAGASYIMYTFFDKYNPTDSVAFVVKYIAGSGVGINEVAPKAEVSNLYPNPAKNYVSINYDLKGATQARLEIRNILGSVVKVVEINETKGTIRVDVSDLTNGVYFYSFIVNDEVLMAKKLVIQN